MNNYSAIFLCMAVAGLRSIGADFSPASVPGLVLWLDAADVNGDGNNPVHGTPVAVWHDKSSAGHDVGQGDISYRPSCQGNAITRADGQQMPAVRFATDWLSNGTIRATAGNLHVFVVSQRTASQLGGDTYQRLVSTSDGADGYDWKAPDWVVTAYGSNGVSQAYGPDIKSQSSTNNDLTIVNISIGRDAANGWSRFIGDVAEVLIYTNVLTGTGLSNIQSYLNQKWISGIIPDGPYLTQISAQQDVWSRSANLSATLRGTNADVYVCWDLSDQGTNLLSWGNTRGYTNLAAGAVVTNTVTNLTLYSTYWYRFFSTNQLTGKANWSAPYSFAVKRGPVGAIRWDAWVGDLSSPGIEMERNLSPAHYHSRLPFFGQELSSTQVLVRATSQAVIDKEIAFAHAAGLDFWAYVTYDESDPLSLARKLHQSSLHKMDMNFCLIVEGSRFGTGGLATWSNQMQRYINFFKEPNYQTVLNGRPLFFILTPMNMTNNFAGLAEARTAIIQLRAAVTNQGLPLPYITGMDFNAGNAYNNSTNLGLDAVSNYAPNGSHTNAPYSTLSGIATNWWNNAKNKGARIIPPVTAGWDRRPRVENPVSWEPTQLPGVGIDKYYARPAPQQLGAHVQAARDWCAANPTLAETDALLIYAWNEIDEGGWIVPTLLEQAEHLRAIQGVLHADPDQDKDGMPDLWETWHFNSPAGASATSDADGDRSTDRSEYAAGTDPGNAQSVFAINSLSRDSVLTWNSVTGRIYDVQFSTNLVSGIWTTLVSNVIAVPSTTVVSAAVPAVQGFYRISVQE